MLQNSFRNYIGRKVREADSYRHLESNKKHKDVNDFGLELNKKDSTVKTLTKMRKINK